MSITNVNGEKVRYSFATNPLLNRSIEWELNGTYNGLTTDLLRTHLAVEAFKKIVHNDQKI